MLINWHCPTAAQACFIDKLSLESTFNLLDPSPTAPEVIIIISFPFLCNFDISSIKEYILERDISLSSFLNTFVPNLNTILFTLFIFIVKLL